MKTPLKFFALVALGMIALAGLAHAEGEVVCIVRPNTSAAVTTGTPSALGDGGTPCSWAYGAVVPMQCDDCVVCYDPNASKSPAGVASVGNDVCANFQTGAIPSDPILIGLSSSQQKISMIVKSVGDGGNACDCKMMATTRRILQ